MHAPHATYPQIGEWYSHEDLYYALRDHWALLVFPQQLSDEEAQDITNTRGQLIALDQDAENVWAAFRAFRRDDKETLVYCFATEQSEEEIVITTVRGA